MLSWQAEGRAIWDGYPMMGKTFAIEESNITNTSKKKQIFDRQEAKLLWEVKNSKGTHGTHR